MEEKKNKEIVLIPLEEIIPNRFQPRLAFDEKELNDLANSILKYGVIQPIVVRQVGEKYEIIAGERRYKASTIAGIKRIPAIINNTDDNTSAEIALLENLQRKNLTVIEEAKSFKKLMDRGFKQETIASKLGISQSSIANKIRLLSLPKSVQNSLLYNKISERHARSLLTLENEEQQRELLNRIINEKLTVKQTEEEVSKIINKDKVVVEEETEPETEPEPKFIFDPNKLRAAVTVEDMPPLEYFDPKNNDKEESKEEKTEENTSEAEEENKRLLDSINNKDDNSNDLIEDVDIIPNIESVLSNDEKYKDINPFQENRGLIDQILNNRSEEKEEDKPAIQEIKEEQHQHSKFSLTIDKIRKCIKELDIEENGINTTELDLDDKYRIIIEIDKDAL